MDTSTYTGYSDTNTMDSLLVVRDDSVNDRAVLVVQCPLGSYRTVNLGLPAK